MKREQLVDGADLAERQEDRGFGNGDVRNVVGRTRAELFGADYPFEGGNGRSRQQGVVDLRGARRRMADRQDARSPADPGHFFHQRTLHRGVSRRGAADRPVGARSRRPCHSYTQDQLLAYMTVEQQEATIRKSIELLEACGGRKVTGWASPVVAFTPETAGLLAKA